MTMNVTETSNQSSEIRHLTTSELDEVNGGLWIIPYAIVCFAIGVAAGGLRDTSMETWTVGQLLNEIR